MLLDDLLAPRFQALAPLLAAVLPLGACIFQPMPDMEAIVTFGSEPITIEGAYFGDAPRTGLDYLLEVDNGVGTIIDSHDPRISTWTDSLIVLRDPPTSEGSFELFIARKSGDRDLVSRAIQVEMYEYTNYPLAIPPDEQGYPIDLEFDDEGTLWVTSEFAKSIYSLEAGATSLTAHTIPQPSEYLFVFVGTPTDLSGLSEDVVVDSSGNVWFTQGGGYLYEGSEINASRVVRYTPSTGVSSCYNIPSNNAQIFGLHLDEALGEVWVAAGGLDDGNFVARFLPATFSPTQSSCLYDFRGPLPASYCGAGKTDGCFSRYDMLGPEMNPAHFFESQDGHIWISQFFGSSVSELDPGTGGLTEYPMPEASGTSQQALARGSGPWSLVPGTAGQLWVLEGFDNQIVEFDPSAGQVLNEYTIPGWDPDYDFAHTLLPDSAGNMWFSMYTDPSNEGTGWLGRFTPSRVFEMFPPLTALGITGGASGLAIDPDTGDIYFGQFWEGSVGRLSKLE